MVREWWSDLLLTHFRELMFVPWQGSSWGGMAFATPLCPCPSVPTFWSCQSYFYSTVDTGTTYTIARPCETMWDHVWDHVRPCETMRDHVRSCERSCEIMWDHVRDHVRPCERSCNVNLWEIMKSWDNMRSSQSRPNKQGLCQSPIVTGHALLPIHNTADKDEH